MKCALKDASQLSERILLVTILDKGLLTLLVNKRDHHV